MHGRIKLMTNEQQEEKLRKTREAKVAAYTSAMNQIQQSRYSMDACEELLRLSGDLLVANPDIITLWNIRREILQNVEAVNKEAFAKNFSDSDLSYKKITVALEAFKKEANLDNFHVFAKLEGLSESDILKIAKSAQDISEKCPIFYLKQLKAELALTEACLKVNPKSYGTWHHRRWVLDHIEPFLHDIWQREVYICDRYIDLDSRNFHGWDHRKEAVKKAEVPPEKEFKFTTKQIETNFSNYSAWHTRSRLLLLIAPDPSGKFPISEQLHFSELKKIQDAAFTDPNDQSAWIYMRWLLNLRSQPLCLFSLLRDRNKRKLIVTVSNKIKLDPNGIHLQLKVNDNVISDCLWGGVDEGASNIFICQADTEQSIDGQVSVTLVDGCSLQDVIRLSDTEEFAVKPPQFVYELSDDLKSVIKKELGTCYELLDLEPGSKWPLLTTVHLMQNLNRIENGEKMLSTIEELKKVDYKRVGYYQDFSSRLVIENELINQYQSEKFVIRDIPLTSLYHLQYLSHMKEVDLSGTGIANHQLTLFSKLISVQNLVLANNKITNLITMPPLQYLESLNVIGNRLDVPQPTDKYPFSCKFLHVSKHSSHANLQNCFSHVVHVIIE